MTENLPNRDRQLVRLVTLIAAFLPLCWLGMQIVHEAGHVVAGWVTGGDVAAVVLRPLAISRTDVAPNPCPLVVVWGGPVFGSLIPITCWMIAAVRRARTAYLWRFFAGFCLIANGAYLGFGVIEPIGDANDILRHGGQVWQLAAFGVVTVIAGLAAWHRQGRQFGLGAEGRTVPRAHILAMWGILLLFVVAELLWTRVTGFR